MNGDLPKWPRLLVKGPRINPELAGEVIVRTMWLPGLSSHDTRASRLVRDAFGFSELYRKALREELKSGKADWQARLSAEWNTWERVSEEIGSLGTQYVWNDCILSACITGANGWVDWSGNVGTAGVGLLSKWPSVEEITDDWRRIAHAFPGLALEAQIVDVQWPDEDGQSYKSATPLVRWTVGRGGVEVHREPGELLRPIYPEPVWDGRILRETRVPVKELRSAVLRCQKKVREGKA